MGDSIRRISPAQASCLRRAATDDRGQAKGVRFDTAYSLQDRGLGTLWWTVSICNFTINQAGRDRLVKYDNRTRRDVST